MNNGRIALKKQLQISFLILLATLVLTGFCILPSTSYAEVFVWGDFASAGADIACVPKSRDPEEGDFTINQFYEEVDLTLRPVGSTDNWHGWSKTVWSVGSGTGESIRITSSGNVGSGYNNAICTLADGGSGRVYGRGHANVEITILTDQSYDYTVTYSGDVCGIGSSSGSFTPGIHKIISEARGDYFSSSASFSIDITLTPSATLGEDPINHKEGVLQEQMTKTKDPINIATGEMLASSVDFAISSQGPDLVLARHYRSQADFSGLFGYGWRTAYDVNLTENNELVFVRSEDGVLRYFAENIDGTYTPYEGNYSTLVKNPDSTFILTNSYGIVTGYSAQGRMTSVTDRNGNTLTYAYDPLTVGGTYIEDSTGRRITLVIDANGRIESAGDPEGRFVRYTYDINGNLETIIDAENGIATYVYGDANDEHNITELANVNGHKTFFAYDTQDRAIMNEQEGSLNRVDLDFQGNGITVATDALGRNTAYEFNLYGLEISRTNPDSSTVTTTWDYNMNKTSVIDELGNVTKFEYDRKGNLTKIVDAQLKETVFEYTRGFNLIKNITDSLSHATNYSYDVNGNLEIITDALNKTNTFTYTPAGNVLTATDELSNVTTFEYNANGYLDKIIDPLLNEATVIYDAIGNVVSSTTPNRHETSFVYDDLNRLTTVMYPDASSVSYTYDSFGNPTGLTDNVGSTTISQYDNGEQLEATVDPLLMETVFVHDNLGQLTSIIDRKNQMTSYEYSSVRNLEKIIYPDLTETTFTHDLSGNLKTITDAVGTTSYNYDTLHRLTDFTDANGFTVGYEYNDVGSVTKLLYPGTGKDIVYTYDELNRLKTVTTWTGHTATYNYDDAGRLKRVDNLNGTTANYEYDIASRLTQLKNRKTDTALISAYEYTLDANGNITSSKQYEPQPTNPAPEDTEYVYNLNGNRLESAGTDIFEYDDEGQLSDKSGTSYTFDQRHFVTSIGTTTYTYNDQGIRLAANRDGVVTKYIYDASGNLLAEADADNLIQRYYIYGAGLLAVIDTATGDVYTYHYNNAGNTIVITDQTQTEVNTYSYTPFGIIINQQENITNPFKFAGQYGIMDEGNNIYYMRARYYDASVGRFISEDPSGMTDGPNLYSYVLSNPVNYVDPDGQQLIETMTVTSTVTMTLPVGTTPPIQPPTIDLGDIVTEEIKKAPIMLSKGNQGQSLAGKEKASKNKDENKKPGKKNKRDRDFGIKDKGFWKWWEKVKKSVKGRDLDSTDRQYWYEQYLNEKGK